MPFLGAALPDDSLSFPREFYVSLLSPLNEGQWLSVYILSSLCQKVAAIQQTCFELTSGRLSFLFVQDSDYFGLSGSK